MKLSTLFLLSLVLCVVSCGEHRHTHESPGHLAAVTGAIDEHAIASSTKGGDWLSYGLDYDEARYSPLDQINKKNVKDLGLAWSLDLGVMRGLEATPIVVDGIMFLTGPWSIVYAVDTRKGALIWTYDPQVDRAMGEKACCDVVNRGVALYEGDIFVGAIDGRLISLDAADGTVNWEVMTVPEGGNYTITGAPRIAKGNVLIGNGGAEYNARGYVTAYDAKTGKESWRFYTVPGDPNQDFENPVHEEAAKTWNGEWWKLGGGGTVWDAIVYDREFNQVIIGVGNGSPWDQDIRSPGGGDNLYLCSIVALDADDGSYKWHYQTTPGDTWDYTSTQPMILADLNIEGADRKVVMQAPKNGFFYVIDRTDGSFISAEPFTPLNWATGMSPDGRPIEAPNARYRDGQNYAIAPGAYGGHNWQPMTMSHNTGYVYIPSHYSSVIYTKNEKFSHDETDGGAASGNGWNVSFSHQLYRPLVADADMPSPFVPTGRLIAWDPVAQKEVWAQEMPLTHWNGGVTSTAGGLVLQGEATGKFRAYDDSDGSILWETDLKTGIIAPPVTYMVDGEQYVTIPVGWGGIIGLSRKYTERVHPAKLYTFKLGGDAAYPDYPQTEIAQLTQLEPTGSPIDIGHGVTLYVEHCVACHGDQFGAGGGALPDLTRSSDAVFNNYEDIVTGTLLAERGMPNFSERLSAKDVEDIKQFFIYSAKTLREGATPEQFLTSIATYQYMADTHYAIKD